MRARTLILSALLGLPYAQAEIAIYQWTDQDGNVHYSQSPPPAGIEATQVHAPAPHPPVAEPKPTPDPIAEAQKNIAQRKAEEQAREQTEIDAENKRIRADCASARQRLTTFRNPRIRVNSADNSGRRLGEEERQTEINRLESFLKGNC